MRKTILTLILILTTSLVSFSETYVKYTINNSTEILTAVRNIHYEVNGGDVIHIREMLVYNQSNIDYIQYDTVSDENKLSANMLTQNINMQTFDSTFIMPQYVEGKEYFSYFIKIIGSSGELFGFKIKPNNTLSVKDKEIEITELIAFPNPTIGDMTIAFNTNNIKTPIFIYSLNGQLVYQDNESRQIGTNRIELNTSNFASGLYLIKVGNEVFKFVKINR